MQEIPFSQARAHLADTLRRVEIGSEPALISRRGQAAGVLMSVAQFQRLSGSSQAQDFAGQLRSWRQQHLGVPDDPWADVRDRSPGRDFAW